MFRYLLTELNGRRNAVFGWGIGLGFFGLVMVIVFPQLSTQLGEIDLSSMDVYEAFGVTADTFGSLGGFLDSYMRSNFLLMMAAYAIITGTGALAGEEDNGTLEMILTMPLPRWQIVLAKALAIGIALFLILLFLFAGFAGGLSLVEGDYNVDVADMFNAALNLWPITMVFAMFSLFMGAYLPSRRPAWVIAVILLVSTFLIANLSGQNETLADIAVFTPFHYYAVGLLELPYANDNLILFAIAATFLALAILSFQRRNVTVGAWPWQRAQIPADLKS